MFLTLIKFRQQIRTIKKLTSIKTNPVQKTVLDSYDTSGLCKGILTYLHSRVLVAFTEDSTGKVLPTPRN